MSGIRSFSDTTTKITSSITIPNTTLSSPFVVAPCSSSALRLPPDGSSRNPIYRSNHLTKFHPTVPPPADAASRLGVVPSRLPLPPTSSRHSFPSSSSKGDLKEEHCSSSVSSSYSSASDSDYDSTSLRPSTTLQRRSAENYSPMTTQIYGATGVTMGNDEEILFNQRHQPTTGEMKTYSEDEDRKRIRRERNKQAAARCRQRRVDLTSNLMAETEALDTARADLQKEVENLMRQKNQLEFILQAHTTQCRVVPPPTFPFGSIQSSVKLESPYTSFIRPPPKSFSSQTPDWAVSKQVRPSCLYWQRSTSPNHMTPMTTANQASSMTSLAKSSSLNSSSMPSMTLTLPTTSSSSPLVSPTTLGVLNSFDFDTMLDVQTGLTPVTGVPSCSSSSSTRVIHNSHDGTWPTLLNL